MSGVNKVILVGRLGKDPEVRSFDNGNIVASFSMATSESYKDKITGEKKEITEWHNVAIWGKLAEVVKKYLEKGAQVYIEGKLRTRTWEKDGVTRYTTEVIADTMVMLGSKSDSSRQTSSASAPRPSKPETNQPISDDDMPF